MRDPHENHKQESIDVLHSQIVNMIEHGGEEGLFVDEVLDGIDLRDIRAYMNALVVDQNLPFKLPLVRDAVIKNKRVFAMLCDYVNAHKVKYPQSSEQRIYFIETSDFAITVIPIELDDNALAINIEPLDYSPPFVREIYEGTGKLQMNQIPFIKFDKDGKRKE